MTNLSKKMNFLAEYIELCKKYNLMIEPDERSALLVTNFNDYWIDETKRNIIYYEIKENSNG